MDKCILGILLCLSSWLSAQQLDIPLLQNVDVTGQVLEVQLQGQQSQQVLLGWQNVKGQQEAHPFFIEPGNSTLDFSAYPSWNGQMTFVVTNNRQLTAKLAPRRFSHQLAQLFKPKYFIPRSINMVDDTTLGGFSFTIVLLGLWAVGFIICLLLKLRLMKSLFISFIAVWALQSFMQTKNELAIFSKLKADNYEISPFVEVAGFIREVKPMLKGQRWSKDQLSGVINSYVKYHLWEEPFVPRKKAQKNDYLITTTPGNRSILFNKNGYYLVQL